MNIFSIGTHIILILSFFKILVCIKKIRSSYVSFWVLILLCNILATPIVSQFSSILRTKILIPTFFLPSSWPWLIDHHSLGVIVFSQQGDPRLCWHPAHIAQCCCPQGNEFCCGKRPSSVLHTQSSRLIQLFSWGRHLLIGWVPNCNQGPFKSQKEKQM